MIKTLANVILVFSLAVGAIGKGPTKLKAEVTYQPEDCDVKAEEGDQARPRACILYFMCLHYLSAVFVMHGTADSLLTKPERTVPIVPRRTAK